MLRRCEAPAARAFDAGFATDGDTLIQHFVPTSLHSNRTMLLNCAKFFSLLLHGQHIRCGRLLSWGKQLGQTTAVKKLCVG